MVNNAFILEHIGQGLECAPPSGPQPRKRISLRPDPCLLANLEPNSVLKRTAHDTAVRSLAQALSSPLEPHTPRDALDDALNSTLPEPTLPPSSSVSRTSTNRWPTFTRGKGKPTAPWKTPQFFEILRAIDKKDLVFLMEVRDRAFELLLKRAPNGDTPIAYALKQGGSHQEVAIILVGAFSRFVNQLDDADFAKPKTKEILRLMRINLKQSIDWGLQNSQSDLISSFLQTLVMSEGEKWVNDQVANIALALRASPAMKPVETARETVRGFATKQLKQLPRGQAIASLDDYVANATGDLIMMAAWSTAMSVINKTDSIPTWYFARDDRVYKAFVERLDRHQAELQPRTNKQLKWQIHVLRDILGGRTISWRGKVDILAEILDREEASRTT